MSDERPDRIAQLAKLVSQSGLRSVLAMTRRTGGYSAEMIDILAEIARSGEQERDKRAAAKALADLAIAGTKVGIEERRLQLAEKQAEGGAGNIIPPLPEFEEGEG